MLLSLARTVNEAPGTLTTKLPVFRVGNDFNVSPLSVPPLPPELPGEIPILAEVGTFVPRVRIRSRLTCITAISIMTSALGLSKSASNFSARTIWSGVPRRIMASCSWRS